MDAFAFQRRVGSHCSAMDDGQLARGHGVIEPKLTNALQDRLFGSCWSGQYLVNTRLAVPEQHKIGKRAAGVDAEPIGNGHIS